MTFFRGSGQATTQMYTVTLYDIKNKFVAFSAAVPEVVDVICEWGSPYVLLVDGKVRIDEGQSTGHTIAMFTT